MKPKPTKDAPKAKARKKTIGAFDMRRICADAECDPRTVERYLNGIGTTIPSKRDHIERVLRTLRDGKYAHLIRVERNDGEAK